MVPEDGAPAPAVAPPPAIPDPPPHDAGDLAAAFGADAAGAPVFSEVLRRAAEDPFAWNFFALLRAVECEHDLLPRIGRSARPMDDAVRLAQAAELRFAPTDVQAVDTDRAGRPRVVVNLFGLLGPNGPLPTHLTEYVRSRARHHADTTWQSFLDIFHHRMLAYFYAAWRAPRPAVHADRPAEDDFARWLASLVGINGEHFQNRDAVPDHAKLFHAGRLAAYPRSADGLRGILAGFFGLPCEVTQFVGYWLALPASCRCALGASPDTATLGVSCVVGARIWDRGQRFRIRIGPMPLAKYERFLPGGDAYAMLADWVRNYVGDEFDWEFQPVLDRREAPPAVLGGRLHPTRLGQTSWLVSKPPDRDPDQAILRPRRSAA